MFLKDVTLYRFVTFKTILLLKTRSFNDDKYTRLRRLKCTVAGKIHTCT